MRIRDGLAALAYLRARPEVDASKIVVGGRGLGAIVALHVAAVDGSVAGAVAADGLASFEQLASAESYAWPHEAFFPGVLKHYDLPELLASLRIPALVLNPMSAQRDSLDQNECGKVYEVLKDKSNVRIQPQWDEGVFVRFVRDVLKSAPN